MTDMHQPDQHRHDDPQPRPEIPLPQAVRHFTEELSLMTKVGLPMVRSLQIAADIEPNAALRAALDDVVEAVDSGDSLSEAMKRHPDVFPLRLRMIVNAGEVGGVIDIALSRAVEMMEIHDKIERGRTPQYTTPAMRHWANTLGHLIGIGVPILSAIKESKHGLSDEAARAVDAVHDSLREGTSMADPMREHPNVFDPVLIQFVEVGEETGELDAVLRRFAERSDTLTH